MGALDGAVLAHSLLTTERHPMTREVFALGGLIVGQLRPETPQLTHASRLRLGAWSPSPYPATGISGMSDLPRP
jgi:hypothetical protein